MWLSLTDMRSCRKARGVNSDNDAMQLKDTSRNRNLENAWRPVHKWSEKSSAHGKDLCLTSLHSFFHEALSNKPCKFCKLLFLRISVVMFWKTVAPPCAGGTGIHSIWLYPRFKCWISDKYCNTKQTEICKWIYMYEKDHIFELQRKNCILYQLNEHELTTWQAPNWFDSSVCRSQR